MKIAIASDDRMTIAPHFGRTRGFVIFDVENDQVTRQTFRVNNFTGHARGLEHAGHQVDRHGPILAALADCTVVISHGMGRRVYQDLSQAGIQTIITDQNDVQEALAAYLSGTLEDHPERGCRH